MFANEEVAMSRVCGTLHEDDAGMKKLRSRITTDGLDRAPHRAFMRAMGLDDAAIAKPMVGVVSMKGEQTPCNMTHDFQVAAAKTGNRGGRRHAARVLDRLGVRRHQHESRGDEVLPVFARADRRLDRSRRPWPRLRCADRIRRMRQDASRRDDGHGSLQRAVHLHLWRQLAAGPRGWADADRARLLRGCRQLHDRRDRRRRRSSGSSAPACRPSAPAPASSPRTPWEWCRRRWA